jgi:cell division transport system permease protein
MKRPGTNRRRTPRHRGEHLWRRFSPRTLLARHAQVTLESLGRLYRNGLATWMTAMVIGIALALPAGLYQLLANLDRLSGAWEGQAGLSVFLHDEINTDAAAGVADQLRGWPEIAGVTLVTPAQALEEFKQRTGFADVLAALEENPLPVVLLVSPAANHTDPASASALQERLRQLPETALVQLDLQWVQRLSAIVDTARRAVLLVSALLALAVLLMVGNTIRLEIQNRREEIVVTKLIGATNAFVRRPFLYSGIWYGVLGAALAWLVVESGFMLLKAPVQRLVGLYEGSFELQTQPGRLLLVLLGGGIVLGLLGSWLAVGRHLKAIEPR